MRIPFLLLSLSLCASAAKNDAARGIALVAEGKYKEAESLLSRAIAADPRNAGALANRCTARYKLKAFEGALSDFAAAVKLSPKVKAGLAASMSDAHYRRALSRADDGKDDLAVEDLYAAVRLDRKNALAYAELGYHAVRKGQHETALPYFDRAVELDSRLAPAFASRATARFALGRGQDALSDADQAILLDPRRADYFSIRARIDEALGRKPQAALDARRAAELSADPRR